MTYAKILPVVLKYEGGYVNDPDDAGGATNKGITQAVYDSYRRRKGLPPQPVKLISDEEVDRIYYHNYWIDGSCDLIAMSHQRVACFHFDTAVNTGVIQAAKLLQRAVGTVADGKIGPKTLAKLRALTEDEVLKSYSDHRLAFYDKIVERRPANAKFLKGWRIRVNKLIRFLINDWTGTVTT